MPKKYFVVSDIHSFYDPLIKALDEKGFDKGNPDHFLVVCGDVFDRGKQTMEVYDFIMSIPKSRRIMIRGNHDVLYKKLLEKDFPQWFDFANKTVRTFCTIAGVKESKFKHSASARRDSCVIPTAGELKAWEEVRKKVEESPITEWIKSDEWVNFAELGNYILVHSFIPTVYSQKALDYYGRYAYLFEDSPEAKAYDPDWRKSGSVAWENAMWGNPWVQYKLGLFYPEEEAGKTLVCGHWHAYDFRMNLDGVHYAKKEDIDFSTYISQGIIALDACTALSGLCNVFVIELVTELP